MSIEISLSLLDGLAEQERFAGYSGQPVAESADLDRIAALPRRVLNVKDPAAAVVWTAHLRRQRTAPCDCVARWGFCITDLKPEQGWALENAMDAAGLVSAIAVGGGKTGIDVLLPMAIPGVRVAVLILLPQLRAQFLRRDYAQWSAHFKVPNLAGGPEFVVGRPLLHVISYADISNPKNSDLFRRLNPDLIIADESHALSDPNTARTKRFFRVFQQAPATRYACQSGTLTKRALADFAPGVVLALRERAPVPIHPPTLAAWGKAIDPLPVNCPPGALTQLCEPGEGPRQGFQRRLADTLGVVVSGSADYTGSLYLHERPLSTTKAVDVAIEAVDMWLRPDGLSVDGQSVTLDPEKCEELTEVLEKSAVERQLACGFFGRWRFPHMEPAELIDRWFAKRKAWRKELRQILSAGAEGLDSPALVEAAAARYLDGYTYRSNPNDPHSIVQVPPKSRAVTAVKTIPTLMFAAWREIADQVYHETEQIWFDTYLINDAAAWLVENPARGIVWVEYPELGHRIVNTAKARGYLTKYFGEGAKASAEILDENGSRSIVASLAAHGTGKNLQRAFNLNLITNPPSDGAAWEQVIGRTHRPGQTADEVTVFVYQHTRAYKRAMATAMRRARYIQGVLGADQKLCSATITFDISGDDE